MAEGYSVGNLKIAFNALDQTSDDFKKLAKNLRAITNLINRISTADLGKFTVNVKEITKAFNPFLTRLEKSTAGLQAFDSVARQIGVRNMSNVATVLDDIQQETREAADGVADFNAEIENGDDAAREYANAVSNVASAAEEIKNPFNIAQAQVSKLTQEMLNLHFATGNLDNGAIQEIRELTNAILASQNAVKQALMSEEELVIEKYKDIQATRKQRIAYLEAELAMGASGKQARQYAKELAELRKQDGQVGKKSGFSKFLGQIKRVAIYRLIRTGLKAVTGAFKDGISALAQFDSGVNKTISQLTTSFTVMKLSVSTALLPLLQAITPIIQQIAQGFANMANVISAAMSKTGYYTKINTDRLLAYNKAANLLDFDKFRSLTKSDEAINLLSTEKVEDLNKELGESKFAYSAIFNVIQQISVLVGNLFETVRQIIEAVVTSPVTAILLNVAQTIIGIVAGVVNLLNKSGLLKPIVNAILIGLTGWGASKIIKGLTTLYSKFGMLGVALSAITISLGIIGNWDEFSRSTKIAITVISSLVAVLTMAAIAALSLKGALTAGIAVPLIVTAISAGAVAIRGIVSGVKGYANGGLPDKGSMFVAGERGAEFVYNMPSGQSGVANVQQIRQAVRLGVYDALQDYGASRGELSDISVALDGEKLYQNTTAHAKRRGNVWAKA